MRAAIGSMRSPPVDEARISISTDDLPASFWDGRVHSLRVEGDGSVGLFFFDRDYDDPVPDAVKTWGPHDA